MKDSKIDWQILKGSIIGFGVCLVISGLLLGGSYYFNDTLSKELRKNKNIFKSISRRYLDVDQEEKLLQDYYPKFVKLYSKGVIGREKRLNWIEALRQSGEKVKLPALKYSISSQEEYTPEFNINYSGYTLYRSSMKLDIGLLHEGDLFKLLGYINKTADGAYTISECTFSKRGGQIEFIKSANNINASCLFYWITIDLADGKGIKIG